MFSSLRELEKLGEKISGLLKTRATEDASQLLIKERSKLEEKNKKNIRKYFSSNKLRNSFCLWVDKREFTDNTLWSSQEPHDSRENTCHHFAVSVPPTRACEVSWLSCMDAGGEVTKLLPEQSEDFDAVQGSWCSQHWVLARKPYSLVLHRSSLWKSSETATANPWTQFMTVVLLLETGFVCSLRFLCNWACDRPSYSLYTK